MIRDDNFNALLERALGPSIEADIAAERRLQSTVARMCQDSAQSTFDRLTGRTAPKPGNGPNTYRPLARATQRDIVALFVPDTSFRGGDWPSFQQAAQAAIDWLRSHRYTVEGGGVLCHGDSFSLDSEPLVYRDTKGQLWFNAAIDNQHDLLVAQVKARRV